MTSLLTLDRELAGVLAVRFDERQSRALAVRLGWDGGGTHTLAEAAAVCGYSRERVRQLEELMRDHVAPGPYPVTEAALRLVESWTPVGSRRAAAALADAGLAEGPFAIDGLVSAAETLGLGHALDVGRDTTVRRGERGLIRAVERVTLDLAPRYGICDVGSVRANLGSRVTTSTARAMLDALPRVKWIDEAHEWFVIPTPRSRVLRTIRKLLSVYPSLRLDDIADGVLRAHRIALPADAVLGLCESIPWLRVNRRAASVEASKPFDDRGALTPVERRLVTLFRSAGPVLRFRRVCELAGAHGLNASSVGVYLTRTPVLQTVSRGHYALRGVAA